MQDRKLSLNSTLPTPMAKNRRVIYMSIKKIDLQTYFYNFRTLRVFRRLSLPLPAAVPSWPLGTDRQKPNFVTKKKKKKCFKQYPRSMEIRLYCHYIFYHYPYDHPRPHPSHNANQGESFTRKRR